MCTGVNYTGTCTNMTVAVGYEVCTNLSPPFLFNVSSYQPAMGLACYLNPAQNCSSICYSPEGCNEIVEYPGYANLADYGAQYAATGWIDKVGSFSCELLN